MSGPRYVWLLDLDGVINAILNGRRPDPNVWPRDSWIHTHAVSEGKRWNIVTGRPVVDFITAVHALDVVDIRLHTTWQHDAHEMTDAVGLPRFPVAEAPEYLAWDLDKARGWWKLPAVRRVLVDEDRPVIWTDDDLSYYLPRDIRTGLGSLGPGATLIEPTCTTGLCRRHLREIARTLGIDVPVPVAGRGVVSASIPDRQ